MEQWVPITGFEESYHVSDHGRVKSLTRVITTSKGVRRLWRGRILKNWISTGGYEQVSLLREGRSQPFAVHRLVCEAFHGPAPEGKPFVLHGPAGKRCNTPDNLRWGTAKENTEDARQAGNLKNGRSDKTHCLRGHEFTDENTRIARNGSRKCRACARESSRKYRESDPERSRERDREGYHRRKRLRKVA